MSEQSYARHAQHPIRTYLAAIFAFAGLSLLIEGWWFGRNTRDLGMISVALAVVVLVSISRTYIIRLQNRIILLEMKVRGAELLTPEQESRLAQLQMRQVIALRFASDAELPTLVDRAARENLSADQIKREIKTWRADHLRT